MSKLKRCIIVLCCLPVFLFSVCPISASAAEVSEDSIFQISMAQPEYNGIDSGYIELLTENRSTGALSVTVFFWRSSYGYVNSSSEVNPYPMVYVELDSASNKLYLKPTGASDIYYYLTVGHFNNRGNWYGFDSISGFWDSSNVFTATIDSSVKVISYRVYGNISSVSTDIGSNLPEFTVLYDDEAVQYNQLLDIISELYVLHEDNQEQLDKLVEIVDNIIILHGDNEEIINKLTSILSSTTDLNATLNALFTFLSTDLFYSIQDIWFETMDIDDKLQTIINILNSQGESNLTTPDTSDLDNYYDAENSLLDNSNVDVSNVVNVEIDQNAMSVVWSWVEQFLNSNEKVIGLYLTVLALGIVALVLGR